VVSFLQVSPLKFCKHVSSPTYVLPALSSYMRGLAGPDAYPPGPKFKKVVQNAPPNFGPFLWSVAPAVEFLNFG
jgi:hypothetical protein